jgi:opacity protein-like surface antigen
MALRRKDEAMGSVKYSLAAGAALFISNAALAADLPAIMPPILHQAVVEEIGSGWYLRGDIGMSNQQVKSLDNAGYANALSVQPTGLGFDSAPIFGLGIGYQWNSWLRFDVTGEYRGKSNFKGSDNVRFSDGGGPSGTGTGTALLVDNYTASKSEWVFMANAYVDLGTWWCVTPFVGAGVGMAYNKISGFRDDGIGYFSDGTPLLSVAFGDSASKWNFAWAVHAGLAYKVTPGLTIELAYRYLSIGDAMSGDLVAFDGTNNFNNPMHFQGITSHDVKLGVRWMLDAPSPQPMMPLMRKG